MRKMNFLKNSLKCGVLSSNLLNCNAMEEKINDSIAEYNNNTGEKNTEINSKLNVEKKFLLIDNKKKDEIQSEIILKYKYNSIKKEDNKISNKEEIKEKEIKIDNNKHVKHIPLLKIFDYTCLNTSQLSRVSKTVLFYESIKKDHKIVDEAIINCDFLNVRLSGLTYPIKIDISQLLLKAKNENVSLNFKTSLFYDLEEEHFVFSDVNANIFVEDFHELEELGGYYSERKLPLDNLEKYLITPCCKTIISKSYLEQIEYQLALLLKKKIERSTLITNEKEHNKLILKLLQLNRASVIEAGYIVPRTCIFCQDSRIQFGNGKESYINFIENRFEECSSLNCLPFYEEIVCPADNNDKQFFQEVINTLENYKLNDFTLKGYENQDKIKSIIKKLKDKFLEKK